MKKIYSLFAAVICMSSLNAQTLTQANHAPIVGDSYQTVDCSRKNLSISPHFVSVCVYLKELMVVTSGKKMIMN